VSGAALFPPGSARRTKRAVLLTVAVLVLATVLCGGGAVLAANMLGLTGCEPRPPYVSAVQEDARRVGSLLPVLASGLPAGGGPSGSATAGGSSVAPSNGSASPSAGAAASGIATVHYHFRDSAPHTCPQIAAIGTIYEGFAELTPERAEALRTGLQWTSADAPEVPKDLQRFAPAGAAWQASADLDKATGAKIWFDAASRTAFFSLRGD
jgi:hypothetical protein